MIRCIIRGNRFQAARVAADRGIPFVFHHEARGETRGDVPDDYLDLLVRWYTETKFKKMLSGFPVGTLLFYAERRGKKI